MAENISRLRTHIRDVSMSDLKDFLESIRKHSDKIGETAMKQVCVCKRERWHLTSWIMTGDVSELHCIYCTHWPLPYSSYSHLTCWSQLGLNASALREGQRPCSSSSLCFFFSSYLWPSSSLVWRKESYQSVPNQRLFQVAFVYARGAVEHCVWTLLQGQCTETRRRPREHIWEKLTGFFIGMQKSPLLSFTVIRARWGEECIKIWNAK